MPRRLAILFAILAACGVLSPALAAQPFVNVLKVADSINPGTQDLIEDAVKKSGADGAEFLIIQLDTPGGLVTSMRGIVKAIMESPVPVVVYVAPGGAQAASAGVFVTVAADIAAMAPGTNIGAASPVEGGTGGDVPKTMEKKVMNDMVAFARSIAAQRGRNADWLEAAVRQAASITAREAYEKNVIDLVADDMKDLLRQLDGWQLKRKGETITLHTKGIEVRQMSSSVRYNVLRGIANPNVAYILLLIGLAGLYFEFSHPGAVFPGVVGAICLVLAFYALQTLSVNYTGVLLILLAVVFFLLEIKVASYGMLSVAGVVALTLGSIMLFRVPGHAPRLAYSVLLPAVVVVSGFFIGVAGLAFRAQVRKPQTGVEAIKGAEAEVVVACAPAGKVRFDGELWNAEADGGESIPVGERVKVISVQGLTLRVKRIESGRPAA